MVDDDEAGSDGQLSEPVVASESIANPAEPTEVGPMAS